MSKPCAAALAAILTIALASCAGKTSAEQPLTPEAKAYVRDLKLSDVGMRATDSYAHQTLTEIVGSITNAGPRTVDHAEVNCLFYDHNGQLVLRERAAIVKTPLKPGASQRFRLAFDDIPDGWNNQMPQLVIAQVLFG